MVYKQIVLFAGIAMLFMIGLDSTRRYILPSQWAETSKAAPAIPKAP